MSTTETDQSRTRNFCIIAHIDHGKSTLADRILEKTGTLGKREMRDQVLDNMDLERERGITIKSHAIRIDYRDPDGETWRFNLIDTPGHVDFSYEVSRSLAACEGALLVVDAAQGIEAQTIANFYLAMEHGLAIIPVINKIDLPAARVEAVEAAVADLTGEPRERILRISARTGEGVDAVIRAMAERIPPPAGDPDAPLQALVFDSDFDSYRGVSVYVRVVNGTVRAGDRILFVSNGAEFAVDEVGILRLKRVPCDMLSAGDVGYLLAGIKRVRDARVGDTITRVSRPAERPLAGFREPKPMVFSGLYPADPGMYEALRDALDKLRLNDAAFVFEPETSNALGFGFRCGYLGLLHMEIVQERLEREYGLDLVGTVPNVVYRAVMKNGSVIRVENPRDLPSRGDLDAVEEPIVDAQLIVPSEYMGNVMKLLTEKRGEQTALEYLEPTRVLLRFRLPLAEVVLDFYDRLKSATRGYASYDYEHVGFQASDMVRLDVLVNGDPVDALSVIVHRDKAYAWGRQLTRRLKKLIPRQLYPVAIQAALGNKVIARETVPAFRKDVTAKCYGGDITRKRKLLEKQREGKRRMKQVGSVHIPQEAFLAVLRVDDESE
ncbi:MAG: elongation factor 4 [Candidatus Eisenbacteria bacterium]|nr:elongation factor 4 [Candidatus Eisenbacteria bacterium]